MLQQQTFTVRLSEREDEKVLGIAIASSSLVQYGQKFSREQVTVPRDLHGFLSWQEEVILPTPKSDGVCSRGPQKEAQLSLLDYFYESEWIRNPKPTTVKTRVPTGTE